MGKQSDDYLDKFSDKGAYGAGGFGEAATSILFPAAGIAIHAAKQAAHEEEMRGIIKDPYYFTHKRNETIASNAEALKHGLFWVELKKNRQLSPNDVYVSENAKKLLDKNINPSCRKVQIDLSDEAFIAGASKSDNFFTVVTATTLRPSHKNRLKPIDAKLIQPEISHKLIKVYTDLDIAICLAKNSVATVAFDDLLSFVNKKIKIELNHGKGTITYTDKKLEVIDKMEKRDGLFNGTQQRALNANEWCCPNCGSINQKYVGTCGCGTKKP